MSSREVFLAFGAPGGRARETYQFRSSWLASSLRALRHRDLMDAYRVHLPAAHHAEILESVAGVWLPVSVAVAHYAAIDALMLPPLRAFEMGREIQTFAHSVVAKMAIRTSKAAGITPWTIFAQLRKLWEYTWVGGDLAVFRVGPKEAHLEVCAWSIARSPYVRHAMRGVVHGITAPFCGVVHVNDMPQKCVGLGLGYRISWV